MSTTPLRVGLIADVQHADINNSMSPYGAKRHYRDAVTKARLAAEDWAAQGCSFAVNLGDTIDRRAGAGASEALGRVLGAFEAFAPVLHVLGNHDLTALSGVDLAALSPLSALKGLDAIVGQGCYCDVRIGPGWRAIIIDTYDIAVRREAAPARAFKSGMLAQARARREHTAHLTEHEDLNGAVGDEQLKWLHERLNEAAGARERVVILAHAPLCPEATIYGDAVCWNYQQVSSVLDRFPEVVAAVITGHDHRLGEAASEAGIYHRILEAAMEGPEGVPTHAILELECDTIRLLGKGHTKSWERTFPAKT